MKTYVDLNLPSGTLWAENNEEGYYTFNEAVDKYGDSLPTKEQFEELKSKCQWEWMDNEYKVTGPNGNTIVLPAAGLRYCNGDVYYVGSGGDYWSSTSVGSYYAWHLCFNSSGVVMGNYDRCYGRSVRLVKNLKGEKK